MFRSLFKFMAVKPLLPSVAIVGKYYIKVPTYTSIAISNFTAIWKRVRG